MTHNKGIYCIKNLKTGKVYIGSSMELKKRINHHFYTLEHNRHHCTHMQNAYNKDPKYFVCGIICNCPANELISIEQYLLNYHRGNLYNLREIAHNNTGIRWTQEQRKKASDNYKKRIFSEETRKKMSESAKTKIINPSFRNKMSILSTNRWKDSNRIAKQSKIMFEYNKSLSDERKKEISNKISKAISGVKKSNESVLKRLDSLGIPSIDVFNLNNDFVANFRTIRQASVFIGGNENSVGDVCRGKQKSYKDFIFKYNHGTKSLS